MFSKTAIRCLLLLLFLSSAGSLSAQEICEPVDNGQNTGQNTGQYPGPVTRVATRRGGGVGCDFGDMGIEVAVPPMPTAQLECVRLEGPSYLGYRCAAHPRGALISYQWTTNTISPYITLEPESDPGVAVLTCNSPPNLWLSANVTATVLGPLNQGSTQMLDVDCTRYEPLNFP